MDTLYDRDFVTWTERQAYALREAGRLGANLPLDWERLAEEIEDLGREVRNKVGSLTCQIQIHLLKLACSPAIGQRSHWMSEVDGFREQLERQLSDNHAVRAGFGTLASNEMVRAVREVERAFKRHGEIGALPLLAAWKLRGIDATEVLTDGLFPATGTLTFEAEST